jgi:hypothetical protein
VSETPDVCQQCGHPSDPHALFATTGDPMEGGIMLCPVRGCRCYSTWGVGDAPAVRVPDEAETEALRQELQAAQS